jgi:hypothetical protein
MKGKLIKTDVNYILEDDKGVVIASTSLKRVEGLSLSLKNCQAIERGYDLDELAMGYDLYENINFVGQTRAYKSGFQKALEILGDKKFSEDDVLKVVTHVLNELVLVDGFDKQYLFPESIYQETTTKCKSLQQTEWDVEIVCLHTGDPEHTTNTGLPKLDENGNLILRKL